LGPRLNFYSASHVLMLALLVLKLTAAQGLPDVIASQFPGFEIQQVALPDSGASGDAQMVPMDGPFVVEEDEPMMFGGFGPDVFGPQGPMIGGPMIGGPAHGIPGGVFDGPPGAGSIEVHEIPLGPHDLALPGFPGHPQELPGLGLPDGVHVVMMNMDPPRPRFRGSRRGPGPIGGSLGGSLEMHISQHALPLEHLAGAFGGLFNPLMVPLHHDKPTAKQNESGESSGRPIPKTPFDGFIHDVLGEMGLKVGDMNRASVAASGGAPPACRNETKKYCADAHPHVMHCLANHSVDLGPGCKATVKKSLPAVCKGVIKKSCDTLEEGVLPCLKRLDGAKKLTGTCADSFHATMEHISRVKQGLAYGATVVNKLTGMERPLVGPAEADSYYDRFKNFAGSLLEPDW